MPRTKPSVSHRNRANETFSEVLLHFENEGLVFAVHLVVNGEGVEDGRHVCFRERSVNDGADDLDDFTVCAHDIRGVKVRR